MVFDAFYHHRGTEYNERSGGPNLSQNISTKSHELKSHEKDTKDISCLFVCLVRVVSWIDFVFDRQFKTIDFFVLFDGQSMDCKARRLLVT